MSESPSARLTGSPADSCTPTVVSLEGLGKRFGQRWLFRGAAMTLCAGESAALLGESGAGKSTLLNIIAALEPFDEGHLLVAGQRFDAGRYDADAGAALRRKRLGFVFQAFHLLPHLSVWQNVALPLLLTGSSPASAEPVARAMLGRTGLTPHADARPATLSGGEQQRVALARALVHRPLLLLADEPTGNLDPDTAAGALSLMHRVIAESGCALLMATHSTQAAAQCTARWRLIDTRLIDDTPPQ